MIFFTFLLNLLLPGTGFLFYTQGDIEFAPSIYDRFDSKSLVNATTLRVTTLLLIPNVYWFALISALLFVSRSGLIFHSNGFYYLLFAYIFVSLLSSIHLAILLRKMKALNNEYPGKYNRANKRAVQVIFPFFYIASLFILLLNKPMLLGWQVYQIPSNSMFPTLNVGDIVLADTRASMLDNLTKQDIVIFTRPINNIGTNKSYRLRQVSSTKKTKPTFYIKRLIANGGDHVSVSNHQLMVNNQAIKNKVTEKIRDKQVIQTNAIFVVGDNVNHSSDSRHWGQLPKSNVVAKFRRVVYRNK